MKILTLDHIGIAVEKIDASLPVWEGILGLPLHGIEEVAEQKVKTAFIPLGESEIELLETTPILDLGMRLGEGTGAALAMNIVEASAKVLVEIKTSRKRESGYRPASPAWRNFASSFWERHTGCLREIRESREGHCAPNPSEPCRAAFIPDAAWTWVGS